MYGRKARVWGGAGNRQTSHSLRLYHDGSLALLCLLAPLTPNAHPAITTEMRGTMPVKLRGKLEGTAAVLP